MSMPRLHNLELVPAGTKTERPMRHWLLVQITAAALGWTVIVVGIVWIV
jgi:hypothetical protein